MRKNKQNYLSHKFLCLIASCCFLGVIAGHNPAYALTTIAGTISGNNSEIICVTAVPHSGTTACDDLDWNNSFGTGSATNGTYSIENVEDGEYYLWVDPECGDPPFSTYLLAEYWTSDSQGTDNCSLAETFDTTVNTDLKNVMLAAGGIISGTISGTNGQEVCINAQTGPNGCNILWVAGGMAASDGTFSFRAPAGTYYLTTHAECTGSNPNNLADKSWTSDGQGTTDCSQAESFSVPVNTTITNKDIALEQGAVISGTISGTNGQEVCVNAVKLRDGADNNCDNEWVSGGSTAADGTFSFNAPAGTYILNTDVKCGGNNANLNNLVDESWTSDEQGTPYCSQAESFAVSTGINPAKNFVIEPGGFISGTITRDPDSGDWNDLEVQILYDNGQWYQWFTSGPVNSDGTYTTNLLPTGNFYVQFIDNSNQFQRELYNNVPDWDQDSAQPVPVTAPSTTPNINVTLKQITDDRYYPGWSFVSTYHTYNNSDMSFTTRSEAETTVIHFSNGSIDTRQTIESDLSVVAPSGTCSDDFHYTDFLWRYLVKDSNRNGIIEDSEDRDPSSTTYVGKVCNLGAAPHAGGNYTYQITLPDSSVLTKTLTGISAGLTTSELPPVSGVTANWNYPSDNELTVSWTLPGITYPVDSFIEIRLYMYRNGSYINNQIRMVNFPNDLTQFTFDSGVTTLFDNGTTDQILIDVRVRALGQRYGTTTRTRQSYSFDREADTLTPAPIHMTLFDVNGDKKTGLEEAIHSLKAVSGN